MKDAAAVADVFTWGTLRVVQGGRVGCSSLLASRQRLTPPRLMHFEGMQVYFHPSGLCIAPGSHSCQLGGRRKM